MTTKIYQTEFWFWHYTVLIYDKNNFELYEMSRPMDRNGVHITLAMGIVLWDNFVSDDGHIYTFDDEVEVELSELMEEGNLQIRTAVKIAQENF